MSSGMSSGLPDLRVRRSSALSIEERAAYMDEVFWNLVNASLEKSIVQADPPTMSPYHIRIARLRLLALTKCIPGFMASHKAPIMQGARALATKTQSKYTVVAVVALFLHQWARTTEGVATVMGVPLPNGLPPCPVTDAQVHGTIDSLLETLSKLKSAQHDATKVTPAVPGNVDKPASSLISRTPTGQHSRSTPRWKTGPEMDMMAKNSPKPPKQRSQRLFGEEFPPLPKGPTSSTGPVVTQGAASSQSLEQTAIQVSYQFSLIMKIMEERATQGQITSLQLEGVGETLKIIRDHGDVETSRQFFQVIEVYCEILSDAKARPFRNFIEEPISVESKELPSLSSLLILSGCNPKDAWVTDDVMRLYLAHEVVPITKDDPSQHVIESPAAMVVCWPMEPIEGEIIDDTRQYILDKNKGDVARGQVPTYRVAQDASPECTDLHFILNVRGNHWIYVRFHVHDLASDSPDGSMCFYDSADSSDTSKDLLNNLRTLAEIISLDPALRWKKVVWRSTAEQVECPRQANGSDCGPLALDICRRIVGKEQLVSPSSEHDRLEFGANVRREVFRRLIEPLVSTGSPPASADLVTQTASFEPRSTIEPTPQDSATSPIDDDVDNVFQRDASDSSDIEDVDLPRGPAPDEDDYNPPSLSLDLDSDVQNHLAAQLSFRAKNGSMVSLWNVRTVLCDLIKQRGGAATFEDIANSEIVQNLRLNDRHPGFEDSNLRFMLDTSSKVFERCTSETGPVIYKLSGLVGNALESSHLKAVMQCERVGPELSDDITRDFDLIIPMVRTSSGHPSHQKAQEIQDRPAAILDAWHSRFSSTPVRPRLVTTAEGAVEALDRHETVTMYHAQEASSSNRYLFWDVYDGSSSAIENVLKALEGHAKSRQMRASILLIGTGWDGLTTENASWRNLTDRFPNLGFRVTLVVRDSAAIGFRHGRHDREFGLTWYHYDVTHLANLSLARTFRNLERGRAARHAQYLLLQTLIYVYKMDHSRQVQRAIAGYARLCNMVSPLIGAWSRNGMPLPTSSENRQCETHRNISSSEEHMVRGSSQALALRCQRCESPELPAPSSSVPASDAGDAIVIERTYQRADSHTPCPIVTCTVTFPFTGQGEEMKRAHLLGSHAKLLTEIGDQYRCLAGCLKVFKSTKAMLAHFGITRGRCGWDQITCARCSAVFSSHNHLRMHEKSCTEFTGWLAVCQGLHVCLICGAVFPRRGTAVIHIKTLHGDHMSGATTVLPGITPEDAVANNKTALQRYNQQVCPHCQEGGLGWEALYDHMRECPFRPSGTCEYCHKFFETSQGLLHHITAMHSGRSVTPNSPKKPPPADRKQPVKANRRTRHPNDYLCQYCDRHFETLAGLSAHFNRAHDPSRSPEPNEERVTHPREYTCKYCERPFASKQDLSEHLIKKHPGARRGPGANVALPAVLRDFVCQHCGKHVPTLRGLTIHIAVKHRLHEGPQRLNGVKSQLESSDIFGERSTSKMTRSTSLQKRASHAGVSRLTRSASTKKTAPLTGVKRLTRSAGTKKTAWRAEVIPDSEESVAPELQDEGNEGNQSDQSGSLYEEVSDDGSDGGNDDIAGS